MEEWSQEFRPGILTAWDRQSRASCLPQAIADFQRRQELSENISHISQKFSTSDWFQLKGFPELGVVSLTLSESLFQVLVQFPHATF